MGVRLGIVADTHNLVRPEAIRALAGVDRILHAGDLCRAHVLETLGGIAPVIAVRGNNDRDAFAEALPDRVTLELEGVTIHMIHDRADLEPDDRADVVISGHSHRPSREQRAGTLWLNPGSAGPRRFRLPVSLAIMTLAAGEFRTELIDLIP